MSTAPRRLYVFFTQPVLKSVPRSELHVGLTASYELTMKSLKESALLVLCTEYYIGI
jgi:hypothetical protein